MVPANNPSEVSRLGFIEPCLLVRRSVMWTCPRAGMPLVAKKQRGRKCCDMDKVAATGLVRRTAVDLGFAFDRS
jgi:hypothetical protein